MKKSKFIKQVLKSKDNTVFVNEEQVANAIEVFEKLGMIHHQPIVIENPNIKTSEDMLSMPALIIKDTTGWDKE